MQPYPRGRKVDELVKEAVALILIEELKDPRLELVTVTSVRVSRDLNYADVYVTAHGGPERYQEVLAGLESASPKIRSSLGDRVRLRRAPELRFSIDESVDAGMRISEILADEGRRLDGEDPDGEPS